MSQRPRICGCMGCRKRADVIVRHPEHGRRAVCTSHASGQEVLVDV